MQSTTHEQEIIRRLTQTMSWGRAYRQPRRSGSPTSPQSPERPHGEASVHCLDDSRSGRRTR